MTDLSTPVRAIRADAVGREAIGAVPPSADEGPWALLASPAWREIREDGFVPDLPDAGRLLVSLPLWRARRTELLDSPASKALLLDENDDPAIVAADLHRFALIVLASPTAETRRPLAWSLRQRYGYQGAMAALEKITLKPLRP